MVLLNGEISDLLEKFRRETKNSKKFINGNAYSSPLSKATKR